MTDQDNTNEAELVARVDGLLSHVWMVRAFLKQRAE